MYSHDGKIWTPAVTNAMHVSVNGVAWNGALWTAMGTNSFATISGQYSIDGMNWHPTQNALMANGGNKAAARQLLPYPPRVITAHIPKGVFVARGTAVVTVSAPEVASSSVVVLTRTDGPDATIPAAHVVSLIPGTGFSVANTDSRDVATYNYRILE
jgi:hypothetical protein